MASKLNLSQGHFLTPEEEFKFLQYYETRLWDFCRHFRPPLPPNVSATALMYFKRFYLNNSVMDYSPRYLSFFRLPDYNNISEIFIWLVFG